LPEAMNMHSATLRIAVVPTALLCAAFLWRVFAMTGSFVPLDPNEGWNAYHTAAAMAGKTLYPGADSFMVNNYPPLSFYIVGAFGRIVGDNIIAGRILSLMGFFATAAGIFASLRCMNTGRWEAFFAALLFAACLLVTSDYVGMNDPQLLGHALGMAGFLLLLKEKRDWRIVAAAALLFAIAGFVKHNLVVQPLAMTTWLFVYDRRSAWRFVLSGAFLFLIGLALFQLFFGNNLFAELNSARVYSFANLTANFSNWLYWGSVPLVGIAILLWLRRDDKYVVLCALYAFLAVVIGTGFLGGDGVDANAMFDADIALALGAGLALGRISARGATAAIFVLPLAMTLWRGRDDEWRDRDFWLHPMAAETSQAHRDIVFLKAHRGPALCEMLSLCYWAGKGAEVDVFNVGQQFLTGARSDDGLARLIGAHYFRALQFDSLSPFALTPRLYKEIARNYRIDHTNDDGVFLLPR
jgi:hypothetical protein